MVEGASGRDAALDCAAVKVEQRHKVQRRAGRV
jgi:hypothetical protein